MDYQTNQTLAKYTAQSQGNYYTYEEQQETEVPNEYIIKKHNLPQLPTEIIDMILYKFGGLQNPIVKDMKELKSKAEYAKQQIQDLYEKGEVNKRQIRLKSFEVFVKDELPLRNIKRFDDLWHDGYYQGNRLTQKSYDFLDILKNNMLDDYDDYYYRGREYSRLGENHSSVVLKSGQYTYVSYYTEVERHLICIKNRTAKQLKEYLDNNGIEYKKSWKKDKLAKICYSF